MKIPEGLGSLEDLKRREKAAFKEAGKWEDLLDDAYEYFLPQRNLFSREVAGQKKMERIFDSTALNAIKQGASKLQDNIAPIWARWASFEPSNEVLREFESPSIDESEIREALEEQAAVVFDTINRSNFGTQFYEFALDLLIGTATLDVSENIDSDEMPIIFSTEPQIGLAYEEGADGTINTHWRRFKVKARNIEQKWQGFEVSSDLRKIINDTPDEDVKLCQGVVFNPKTKEYDAIVWVEDEDKISWHQSEETSPKITARYSKVAGEVRGRGPALDALPDVRSLNKAKEFVLTKAAIDLSGIWTATDDGVINPYAITVEPGVVIPVGSNNSSNPTLARLDTSADLNLALFEIQELQNQIKYALFSELREPSDSVVSATQFAIEARELAKRIGSAFGRLQTEALIPILKRVHSILVRRGALKPVKIGGREVAIKFTSPLARAQDGEDLLSVQQAVEFVLASAGEDQVKMAFKSEDFGTWAAKKTGMPQELVRSEAEKKEIIRAGAEAAKEGLLSGQHRAG